MDYLLTPRFEPELPDDAAALLSVQTPSEGPQASPLTAAEMVKLYAFCFGYGFTLTTYALITFPSQAVRFFPETHDFGLAVFLMLAGVAQAIGPAVGFISDRCSHPCGKRRPFLFAGGVVLMPCLSVQWLSSSSESNASIAAYYLASFVGMLCLCLMQTVVVGFTPDLVPRHQTGQANGILVSVLGAGAAAGFATVILLPHIDLYLLYTVVLVGTTLTTLAVSHGGDVPAPPTHWEWRDVAECYYISPTLHPAYFWLFFSRSCYYTGTSTQSFLQYYFRDWVLYPNGEHLGSTNAKAYTAAAAFIAQVGIAVSALPAGHLSDRVGRKVILHCVSVGIAVCFVLNIMIRNVMAILVISFAYGVLNGASLSVSYALAVDCLPSKRNAAQWLAIWDIAAFIGTTLGPMLYAPALFFLPPRRAFADYEANSDAGYVALMSLASVFVLIGAFLLRRVSGKLPSDRVDGGKPPAVQCP
eukprot:TRINITY_DN6275_c0_g1_i1.p1 TRINITY_DN6275_c0_g1~~TRINITY_DN6275_c0_g1_i1.p1  ORF type:complete len:472 (+),score=154.58 TRINITY_DN6275_c0_g1_i1:82-1497(+)